MLKEDDDTRGRERGAVAALLRQSLMEQGVQPARIHVVTDEVEALDLGLRTCREGDLLLVFGALYAMRGAGVLAWFLRPGRSLLGLVVGVALLLLLRDGAAIALGLVGLGDTWADWRRRIRPAVS